MKLQTSLRTFSISGSIFLFALCFLFSGAGFAQEAGNRVRDAGNSAYGSNPKPQKRMFGNTNDSLYEQLPTTNTFNTYAVDAKVLINITPDEYLVTFALVQEGPSPEACTLAIDERINQFKQELQKLGISPSDIFVDFVTQTPVYDYKVKRDNSKSSTATEYEAGFELKKNLMIRYTQRDLLDGMTQAAARYQIYDLVKVDFIVRNPGALREKLRAEALGVIRRKLAESEKILGIKYRPAAIDIERYSNEEPGDLYRSYTAFESSDVATTGKGSLRVLNKRKPVTYYFEGVDTGEFDVIINPVITSPVAQYGVYVRVRCDPEVQVPITTNQPAPK